MKNKLKRGFGIVLVGILLSISNNVYANELDGFDEIFNDNELHCGIIEEDMLHYPHYQTKIDNFFGKISKKSSVYQKKIYRKLDSIATKKLKVIDQNKQEKAYTIIGYIKCEARKRDNNLQEIPAEAVGISYKLEKNHFTDGGYSTSLYLITANKKLSIVTSYQMDISDVKINPNVLSYKIGGMKRQYKQLYFIKTGKVETFAIDYLLRIGGLVENQDVGSPELEEILNCTDNEFFPCSYEGTDEVVLYFYLKNKELRKATDLLNNRPELRKKYFTEQNLTMRIIDRNIYVIKFKKGTGYVKLFRLSVSEGQLMKFTQVLNLEKLYGVKVNSKNINSVQLEFWDDFTDLAERKGI